MQMLVWTNLNLAYSAGARSTRRLTGAGDALGQHDSASEITPCEVGSVAIADINQMSGHAVRRRTARTI